MILQEITSLDIPELKPYRTLRRQEEHKEQGIFVAEGEKVVRRLLASGLPVVSMLASQERFALLFPPDAASPPFPVFIAPHKILESIAGIHLHQGIMAVGRIPHQPALDQFLGESIRPLFIAALDGIAHAENVGVIVRNCAAFGVQAVIVGEASCSPYLRRAVRNSMGTVFTMHITDTPHLGATLTTLKETHAFSIVAAHPHASTPIQNLNLSGDVCVVFGGEDSGVSTEVMQITTHTAAIPMRAGVDSLNVGSASAVVLYEISRYRHQR